MDKQIRDISKKRTWKRILKRSVALLCAVVMLFTMNTLKRNADTLEHIPMCGYAEHVHSASCFSGDVLVCGMEEHVHTDACYQESPASMDMDDLDIEVDEPIVDETVEDLDLSLELDGLDLVTEDVVAEPVSNAVEEKVYSLGTGAMVSRIIEAVGLGIGISDLVEVAAVENDEAHSGLIAVERVDGDYSVWAKRDFAEADLALIVTDDIYVVKLRDGIARREDATPEAQPEAAAPAESPAVEDEPAVDVHTEDDDGVELPVVGAEVSVDGQAEESVLLEDVSHDVDEQGVKVEQLAFEGEPDGQAEDVAPAEEPDAEGHAEGQEAEDAVTVEQPAVEGEPDGQAEDVAPTEQPDAEDERHAEEPEAEDAVAVEQPAAEGEPDGQTEDVAPTEQPDAEDERHAEGQEAEDAVAVEQPAVEGEPDGQAEDVAPAEQPDAEGHAEGQEAEDAVAVEQPAAEGEPDGQAEGLVPVEEESDEAASPEDDVPVGDDTVTEEDEGAGETALIEEAEQADDQPAGEETAEEQGEEAGEETAETPVYTATIDLAEVETYPLSLNAMLTAANPEVGETEEAAAEGEIDAEAVAVVNPTPIIEYDAELLEVVGQDGDWLVTPVRGFEETQIAVDNGKRYELTLVNCVLADETGEEQEAQPEDQHAPVYTAIFDLTDATYPLSLNAMLSTVTPALDGEQVAAQDDEQTAEAQPEEQPEERPTPAIEYDEALLEIVASDGDWLITPIQGFESARITVTDVSVYALTLVNCALPDEAGAAQPEIAYPAQTFEGHTDYVKVSVTAPEGAFPEGTTMTVADVEDEKTITDIEEKVSEDFVEVKRVHAVDISFWNGETEIEPLVPISVVISVAEIEEQQDAVVVHVDNEGATEVVESQSEAPAGETEVTAEMPASEAGSAPSDAGEQGAEQPAEDSESSEEEQTEAVAFSADSFSVYAVVVTETIETKYIDAEGETWNISVGFTKEANIPAGAKLDVSALADEESAGYYDQAADALKGRETITMARFFDITIRDAEGAEVQPHAPVEVKVVLDEASGDAVKAVHFAEAGMELIDADRDAEGVTFEAEGFSVYGIVYTVDFYYGVDGQSYEYHIEGGSVQSLRALLPKLGVVAEDEAAGFMADIEAVSFSDETLVKPVAVTEDTTAGAIVDALGVEIEYSGNLSEADVEAIRARAFTAPDWALVSIKPFNTEEALTITLATGETLTLRVTDAAGDGYFRVSDANKGYLLVGGAADVEGNRKETVPDGLLGFSADNGWVNRYRVDAVAKPGHFFWRWELANINNLNGAWAAQDSRYQTSRIAGGTVTSNQIYQQKLVFTAKFADILRGLDVDSSSSNRGFVRCNGQVGNSSIIISDENTYVDDNGNNRYDFEAVPYSGNHFVRWNYYKEIDPEGNAWDMSNWQLTATYETPVIESGTFKMDKGENWFLKAVFEEGTDGKVTVNDWNLGHLNYKSRSDSDYRNYNEPLSLNNNLSLNGDGNGIYSTIFAYAKPGNVFCGWTLTDPNGNSQPLPIDTDALKLNYGLEVENGISKSFLNNQTINGEGKWLPLSLLQEGYVVTAIFRPSNRFTVQVSLACAGRGSYASQYLDKSYKTTVTATEGQVFSGIGNATPEGDRVFARTITPVPNSGYKFAFWMYIDGNQYKALSAIHEGTPVPFDNVALNAMFVEEDKNLIIYQSEDNSKGAVSTYKGGPVCYSDDVDANGVGATVTPAQGQNFLGWFDQDGVCISREAAFKPELLNRSAVLTARFGDVQAVDIDVTMNREGAGTVTRMEGDQEVSCLGIQRTDNWGQLQYTMTAKADEGYSFGYWAVNDVPVCFDATIGPENSPVEFFNSGDVLQAVFGKLVDANSNTHQDITVDATSKREFEEWLNSMGKGDKLMVDKTVKAYNYEDRIYQVDITARSSLVNFGANIDLAFILDASNSMQFPSNLQKDGNVLVLTQESLNAAYPEGGIHYFISDPTGTSTVFRLFKENGIWYAVDDSLPNSHYSRYRVDKDVTYAEQGKNKPKPFAFPIYDAVGDRKRKNDLNTDVKLMLTYMKDILTKVRKAGGEASTADIGVAYSTFAAYNRTYHPDDSDGSPFTFSPDFVSLTGNVHVDLGDTGGGTRQDLALAEAEGFHWNQNNSKYAILITDGAPVVNSKGSWDGGLSTAHVRERVAPAAEHFINSNGGITLITVGLGTKNVTWGSETLKDIASPYPRDASKQLYFEAENGEDLEGILYEIVRTIIENERIGGKIVDKVDTAFYPVQADGTPIQPGRYRMNGDKVNDDNSWNSMVNGHQPCYEWTVDAHGDWTITWYNQTIGWDRNSSNEADRPWNGTIFVKAKENFLGGNTIPTNEEGSVTPKAHQKTEGDTNWYNYTSEQQAQQRKDLPVPHVNVDELALTQNSTAWTVYLGTEVDPKEQMNRLFEAIDVRKVVSDDTNEMITDKDQMLHGTGESSKTFKLSTVVEALQENLTQQIWSQLLEGQTVILPYGAYDHSGVGSIVISLTQTVVENEEDLTPSPHDTEVVGENVEQYRLAVSYVPAMEHDPTNGWHTTPGGTRGAPADTITSTNEHRIHVFVKGIMIKKMDATLQNRLIGAKFMLYRPALREETENTLEIEGGSYVPATVEFTVDGDGVADIGPIKALKSGNYYLVETQAPEGYVATAPMRVVLTLQDTFAEVAPNSVVEERPSVKPYNWVQKANLVLEGSTRRSNERWEDSTQPEFDSNTSTVYYRIPNNSGVSLPNTGGMGTTLYYVAGAALLLLALALLLRKRSEN